LGGREEFNLVTGRVLIMICRLYRGTSSWRKFLKILQARDAWRQFLAPSTKREFWS